MKIETKTQDGKEPLKPVRPTPWILNNSPLSELEQWPPRIWIFEYVSIFGGFVIIVENFAPDLSPFAFGAPN